jgi:hypothetical protein
MPHTFLLARGSRAATVPAFKHALAAQLGAESRSFPGLLSPGDLYDADTEAACRRWQAGTGLVADGVAGPHALTVLGLRTMAAMEIKPELEAVKRLFPQTKPANIVRYLPYVTDALEAVDLLDRAMVLAALGTIRAETAGFVPIAEYPSRFNTLAGQPPFSAYEPGTPAGKALGNTHPGDGARYRGRGFVQLTGADNYSRYTVAAGIDLVGRPELANSPEVAALLLALFLADHATEMRAALAAGRYAAARKLVNGGAHGLEEFKAAVCRGWSCGRPARPPTGARPARRSGPRCAWCATPARIRRTCATGSTSRRRCPAGAAPGGRRRQGPVQGLPQAGAQPGRGRLVHRLRPGLRHQLRALATIGLPCRRRIGQRPHALQLRAALRRVRGRGLPRLQLPRRAQGLVQPRRVPRIRLARPPAPALRLRRPRAADHAGRVLPHRHGIHHRPAGGRAADACHLRVGVHPCRLGRVAERRAVDPGAQPRGPADHRVRRRAVAAGRPCVRHRRLQRARLHRAELLGAGVGPGRLRGAGLRRLAGQRDGRLGRVAGRAGRGAGPPHARPGRAAAGGRGRRRPEPLVAGIACLRAQRRHRQRRPGADLRRPGRTHAHAAVPGLRAARPLVPRGPAGGGVADQAAGDLCARRPEQRGRGHRAGPRHGPLLHRQRLLPAVPGVEDRAVRDPARHGGGRATRRRAARGRPARRRDRGHRPLHRRHPGRGPGRRCGAR